MDRQTISQTDPLIDRRMDEPPTDGKKQIVKDRKKYRLTDR
jgi:hypothetical protein